MKTIFFRHRTATVSLLVLDESNAILHSLYSQNLGRGEAKALMGEVLTYANLHELTIRLRVQRFRHLNREALTNDELVIFYQKFGFVKTMTKARITYMTRRPSQQKHRL